MTRRFRAALLTLFLCISPAAAQEPLREMIDRGLDRAKTQSLILARNLRDSKDALPRTWENGELKTTGYSGWISGFFPGVLWMMYEETGDNLYREYAELYTARIEPAKKMTSTHDLGFMLMSSFGQGYRLTGNPHYLEVIHEGTDSLLTRWNPSLGVMKSWNENARWKFPVIIDNMMNLEMLCFCSHTFGDRHYEDIAVTHSKTTIKNHFRDDASTWHVVSYDPETKVPHTKNTAQGYSDDSAWARGQSWGLYGYTMMYRETLDPAFLEQARKIARFLKNHPNLPADKIPCWDYNAPGAPNTQRDASAGAIMASALIELSQLDPGPESAEWLDLAIQQLRTLSSPEYLAAPGEQGGFILKHSVGSLPGKAEVDVPLTYADYYYIEALQRLKKLLERPDGAADRKIWVETLTKIAEPVLTNLAEGTLRRNMPYETRNTQPGHQDVSYLEAVGRTICGIAPWLELGPDSSEEGQLRERFIELTVKGLKNAVDPASPDYLTFGGKSGAQALVDAAFLAEGVLRAPTQIWKRLDKKTQKRLVTEWKRSREISPGENNWLLFASTVEAALLEFAGEYDKGRLMYGVKRFRDDWYKGDAWYGDGKDLHLDYYNSLVIHPMFTEVLKVMDKHGIEGADFLPVQEKRLGRYATELERIISPEGTYPVIGRSIAYRFGSFHALADAAWLHLLPSSLSPAQVRSALTAVISRQIDAPGTFDRNGWLRVGYAGNQIQMGETYINTGSVYLCTAVFLPLGLPASDPFWAAPGRDWTSRKAWCGVDVGLDHSI
jgi:hypothetical protein